MQPIAEQRFIWLPRDVALMYLQRRVFDLEIAEDILASPDMTIFIDEGEQEAVVYFKLLWVSD